VFPSHLYRPPSTVPMRPRTNSTGLDFLTFSIYLALVAIGWAMIYTVGYGQEGYEPGFVNFMDRPVGKQLIWIIISLGVVVVVLAVETTCCRAFSGLIDSACVLLLIAVLIFGKSINSAKSWFDFGAGMTIQASEFAKIGTCLALASFLSMYTN